MNKSELIAAIAEKTGQPEKTAVIFLDATLEVIKSSLETGETVELMGFGSFKRAVRFCPGKSLLQSVVEEDQLLIAKEEVLGAGRLN